MALKLTATPETFLIGHLQRVAEAQGLNWMALLAWGEKYGVSLFIPVILDLIAGNWSAAIAVASAQGAACVADLLAALGIVVPVTP